MTGLPCSDHADRPAHDLISSRRRDPAARAQAIAVALHLGIERRMIASLAGVDLAEVDYLACALDFA